MTSTVGLPLVVLTADCAPVALVAREAVGVVHVGWAGLEQRVIGDALDALRRLGATRDPRGRRALHPTRALRVRRGRPRATGRCRGTRGARAHRPRCAGARSSGGCCRTVARGGYRRDRRRRDLHLGVARPLLVSPRRPHRSPGTRGGPPSVSDADSPDVAAALGAVHACIVTAARVAGRDPAEITVVAATKTVSVARIRAALDAGVADLGENRAQELLAKAPELAARARTLALRRCVAAQQGARARALGPLLADGRPRGAGRRDRAARPGSAGAGRGEPGRRAPERRVRARRRARARRSREGARASRSED